MSAFSRSFQSLGPRSEALAVPASGIEIALCGTEIGLQTAMVDQEVQTVLKIQS